MGRKPLIVGGAAAAIVIALIAFLMTRGDGDDTAAPAAEVTTATDTPSPSAATTTNAPPATTTAAPVPTTPTQSAPAASAPATKAPPVAAPTKPSTAKVFARPPATFDPDPRGSNTYAFYVEQLSPLDSVVDVHVSGNGISNTLRCPTPVSPGNCRVFVTTSAHNLTVTYYVTVNPTDPEYTTYNSAPLQFTIH